MLHRPKLQSAGALALAIVTVALVMSPVGDAFAQTGLPDLDVVLVAQVQEAPGWLVLHQEILTSAATKRLRATLLAATGGGRSLEIDRPKVSVEIVVASGRTLLKVGVTGKVVGPEIIAAVAPFEFAALEVQAGTVRNDLTLQYGLSSVAAQLLELYIIRN